MTMLELDELMDSIGFKHSGGDNLYYYNDLGDVVCFSTLEGVIRLLSVNGMPVQGVYEKKPGIIHEVDRMLDLPCITDHQFITDGWEKVGYVGFTKQGMYAIWTETKSVILLVGTTAAEFKRYRAMKDWIKEQINQKWSWLG